MAYEFLKKLFGEPKEGEAPKAMTYAELETALDAANDVQVVNLKDGGYVAKDKFDAKDTELKGVKQQLSDANTQIQSFKGKATDIDAANQKVAEWEAKYNTDTKALQDRLDAEARSHAEDMFLSGYKFTSKAARNGVLADFRAKNFKLENGEFQGGKEYLEGLMKQEDYKGAFVIEDDKGGAGNSGQSNQNQQQGPRFSQGTSGGNAGGNGGGENPFNFGFTRLRQPPQPK